MPDGMSTPLGWAGAVRLFETGREVELTGEPGRFRNAAHGHVGGGEQGLSAFEPAQLDEPRG